MEIINETGARDKFQIEVFFELSLSNVGIAFQVQF